MKKIIIFLFVLVIFSNFSQAISLLPVKTNEEVYVFDAKEVGIVEGVVSKDIALSNVKAWNSAMNSLSKNVKIVQIDKLDAFFEVADYDYRASKFNALRAIRIPSNIHLKMSDDVYLRVQPNASFSFHLLSVFEVKNVKITGGHLIGDRYEHNYSPISDKNGNPRNSHEWGYCLSITSSKNITVDNVYISSSSGDGINVNASKIRNRDGSPGTTIISENINIKNCFITECRRNNISIVDGNHINIIDNLITKSGLGKEINGSSSAGIAPKAGLDIEAYNENGSNGEIYQYEKVENVMISGNTFKGNRKADIILFISQNVLIEGNNIEKGIVCQYSSNSIIRKNTLIAKADEDGNMPTSGISTSNSRRVFNIEISYNDITGFENGLTLNGKAHKVHHNRVNEYKTGLVLGKLEDTEIYDNTYKTNQPKSYGLRSINGYVTGTVYLFNENFQATNRPLNFINYNQKGTGTLNIKDCTFNTSSSNSGFKLYLYNSKNINFKNITSNRNFEIVNSENINY